MDIEVVHDPAALAARELSRLLVDRGVTVERGPRAAALAPEVVDRVASVESPPLRDILRHMVQRSDNQVADTLINTVAVARTGTGAGRWVACPPGRRWRPSASAARASSSTTVRASRATTA